MPYNTTICSGHESIFSVDKNYHSRINLPNTCLMDKMGTSCLECGDALQGRTDKKFCGDCCRNAYHNRMRFDQAHSGTRIRMVNQILKRNREILYDIAEKRTHYRTITVFHLKVVGFEFNFTTHVLNDRKGNPIHCCYDIGYQLIDQQRIRIIRNV